MSKGTSAVLLVLMLTPAVLAGREWGRYEGRDGYNADGYSSHGGVSYGYGSEHKQHGYKKHHETYYYQPVVEVPCSPSPVYVEEPCPPSPVYEEPCPPSPVYELPCASPEPSPCYPSPVAAPKPCPSPVPSPCPSPKPSPCPSPKPSPVAAPKPSPCPSPVPSPCPSPKPSPKPSPSPIPSPVSLPAPYCSGEAAYHTSSKTITTDSKQQTTCFQLETMPVKSAWDIMALQFTVLPECQSHVVSVTIDSKEYQTLVVKNDVEKAYNVRISGGIPTYDQLKATPSKMCITMSAPCTNARGDSVHNQIQYFAQAPNAQAPMVCQSDALIHT